VDWWERDAHQITGGNVIRMLQMLRIDLPVPAVPVPEGAVLRMFEPMHDEDRWLEQNNAAFAHHPEQGAWQREDLAERTNEPWFDPSGFLLLEIDGRLAASCWTKVHELHPDRFGEIYVVSVHPDFQGRDLGRVMVSQGLASLRKKGVATAVLFVDQSNVVAIKLYESIGFWVGREDYLVRFTRAS
jgi:mycothiol synthase